MSPRFQTCAATLLALAVIFAPFVWLARQPCDPTNGFTTGMQIFYHLCDTRCR